MAEATFSQEVTEEMTTTTTLEAAMPTCAKDQTSLVVIEGMTMKNPEATRTCAEEHAAEPAQTTTREKATTDAFKLCVFK